MTSTKAMEPLASKLPPVLTGVAGEYFVAAELSRRGWIASITLRNTRGIDILVTNQAASRSVTVQCKTRQSKGKRWMVSQKDEAFFSDDHFYVFVGLGDILERPAFHVVPSEVVARHIRESHQKWLATPSSSGKQHVDSSMRKFSDPNDEYLERWDLMNI